MTEKPTIQELLHRVMRDVPSIGKSDFNDFHRFNFRGIDTVLERVGPALRTHGVVVIPEVRNIQATEARSTKDKPMRLVVVTVAYTFQSSSGDSVTAVVPGEAWDTEDKASSKAMSVAFRTALLQVLAVPTNERDPHAGPPMTAARAKLRARGDAVIRAKGWLTEEGKPDWARFAGEYSEWSQGADVGEASDGELDEFLRSLEPKQTMQRGRK